MLKVYATDFDKDSTNDDPKTYEIDQFWMTFQPAELQLQTPHTIVHYRNYSKSGRDVEPTTYDL